MGIATTFLVPTNGITGSIIFLNGTSSAGKSSIADALLPMLGDQTELISIDQIENQACTKDEREFWAKSLYALPVFFVLVYCPPEKLLQHVLARNQSAKLKQITFYC